MAPTKRARPAFSPPRPRKTARTSTKSTTAKVSASKSKKGPSKSSTPTANRPSKPKSKSTTLNPRRRSKLVSPTPSASDSLGGDDSDQDDDNDDGNDTDNPETTSIHDDDHATSSPEPDYILAEITHAPASTTPPIPPGLIHRILHSRFSAPEKTKISTDARDVVGKYIEVFVREAIMRCAYEKRGVGGEEGAGAGAGAGGWLELEDLERVAVQLCLDF